MLDPVQALAVAREYYGDARCGWPPEQVELLKSLVSQNLSASEIGNKMGRTRNSIIGKCDRMGFQLLNPRFNSCQKTKNKIQRKFKRNYREEPRSRLNLICQAEPVESLNIGLLDLQAIHCRAVTGETDDNCLPTYCGHPVAYRSYCAAHAKVYFMWRRR